MSLIGRYIYDVQLLLKSVRVRNGIALLEPSNVELKGWQNEDMQINHDQEFTRNLRRRMGFVPYPSSQIICLTCFHASLENQKLTPVRSIRSKQQNPGHGQAHLHQEHHSHIPPPLTLQPKPHGPNMLLLPPRYQRMELVNWLPLRPSPVKLLLPSPFHNSPPVCPIPPH